MISVLIVDFVSLLFLLGFKVIGKDVFKEKLNYFMASFLILSSHLMISIRMLDTYNSVESKIVMMMVSIVIGFVYFIIGGFIIDVKKLKTIMICESVQVAVMVLATYFRL